MKDGNPGTGGFSTIYGRLLEQYADQIGELRPRYGELRPRYGEAARSVREEIVRCIWFGGHFSPDGLSTDDGRRLEVLSPGWWNVEGGPDFVGAELLLEGEGRLNGEVEVHTLASGWYAHGHHRQPEYADVALHVVMWNDRDEADVATAAGRRVPQLTLSAAIDRDFEELVEIVDSEGEPAVEDWHAVDGKYCGGAYAAGDLDPAWLGRLLDAAGDYRLLTRADAVSELFRSHSREQILYERIAEALGYKNNRMPFMQLAGLLPIARLRKAVPRDLPAADRARRVEAAMFRTAGLLDVAEDGLDEEARQYRDRLMAIVAEGWVPQVSVVLSSDHWQFGATRPTNYPGRRVAALARLCAEHLHDGLFRHFLRTAHGPLESGRRRPDVVLREALLDAFLTLRHPYWSRHYRFGGGRLEKERALVGHGRAMSILINVLLPSLLAHARSEGDEGLAGRLHGLWRHLPRRPGNAVTRRMGQAIFESAEQAGSVVNCTRRQQGLHQLYRDGCRNGGCESCVLYLAHKGGHKLMHC